MNRFAMFCAGLLLMGSMSGCCLFHGAGYGAGYPGYGSPCGGCATGGCGVAPGGYPGGGGFPTGMAPGGYPSAFAPGPQTAFGGPIYGAPTVAMDPLPTIIR